MQILSIGNSFSQDAQTYVHRLAKELFTVNLFIGGCSLELHYRNMLGDKKSYLLEVCGLRTGFNMSIKEALLSRKWDVITLQQVSSASFRYESYMPYIEELAAYVRKCNPAAKLYLHETWGYESNTERIEKWGFRTMDEMSEKVFATYAKVAETIGADGIIPSGHGLLALSHAQDKPVHRDGSHADFGIGRYMLGCVWYETLTGKPVTETEFSDFDVPVAPEEAALVREVAHKTVTEFLQTQRG
jgi:hypothetical protein